MYKEVYLVSVFFLFLLYTTHVTLTQINMYTNVTDIESDIST